MTKNLEHLLRQILSGLKDAQGYILSDIVAVGWIQPLHPNVKTPRGDQFHDCRLNPGMTFTPMDKQIGSKLAYLHNAVHDLQRILDGDPEQENYFKEPLKPPAPDPDWRPKDNYDW